MTHDPIHDSLDAAFSRDENAFKKLEKKRERFKQKQSERRIRDESIRYDRRGAYRFSPGARVRQNPGVEHVGHIPGFPDLTRLLPLNEGFRGRGSKVSMTSGVVPRSGSGSVHSSGSRREVRDEERLTVPSRSGPLRYNEDGRPISDKTQGAIPKSGRSFASRIFGSRAGSQNQYLPNPAPSGRSGVLSQNQHQGEGSSRSLARILQRENTPVPQMVSSCVGSMRSVVNVQIQCGSLHSSRTLGRLSQPPQAGSREPQNVPSGAGSQNRNNPNRAGSRIQGPQFKTQNPMHSMRHVPTAIAPLGNMERTYIEVRKSLPFRHGTFPLCSTNLSSRPQNFY